MSASPRQLRRAKTDINGDIERFNVKLKKIKTNSEKLSRRSRPERKAKRLLQDMKSLPRPRSPSSCEAYLDVLSTIGDSTSGCEKKISKLAEKPDLSQAIDRALEKNSVKPLLEWPEKLWNKSAFKQLSIDSETGKLRENNTLLVRLMATWMMECGTVDTYLREDNGGGRRLLKYLVAQIDHWNPVLGRDLFRQCIIHCTSLPPPLLEILRSLRTEVNDLSVQVLLSAMLLGCYLPKAQRYGFSIEAVKQAMKSCNEPPKEISWMLERVYQCIAPKNQLRRLSSSVES